MSLRTVERNVLWREEKCEVMRVENFFKMPSSRSMSIVAQSQCRINGKASGLEMTEWTLSISRALGGAGDANNPNT
jgi:hypothetical protein